MSRQLRSASRSRWKFGEVFLSVFSCCVSRKGTPLVGGREGGRNRGLYVSKKEEKVIK